MNPQTRVVAGAFATQFAVIGVLFSTGLFIKVFELEFGWSRTLVSGGNALAMFMMGLLAVGAGRLSDRLGPRVVLSVTGICYGVGLAALSQISVPWHYYLLMGTLVAVGLAAHDVVTLSTIAHWFARRRGVMTAVAKVGTALGQVSVPLVVAALIAGVGWRSTFLVIGVGAALVLVLAASLMRNPGPDEGAMSGGGQTITGLSRAQARATRTLWVLCLIQLLFFSTLTTLPMHLAAHGMDLGLSTAKAASLLSVIGGASVLGRLAVGALIDRIGCRNALSLCLLILAVVLVGFTQANGKMALFAVSAVYGFSHGALFVVVSPTVAYYFGMRAHGELFGTVLFFGTIGGAIGPIATGATFDSLGSYTPAFITLALFAFLALILTRTLPVGSEMER